MMEDELYICIFPYVEISTPIRIRGEILYSASNIDEINISQDFKGRLKEIFSQFYWYNNKNISTLTWAILSVPAQNRRGYEFKRHLEEIRKILGYFCCLPDDRIEWFSLNYNYEQVDYFLFKPKSRIWRGFLHSISLETFDELQDESMGKYVDGYEYSVNQVAVSNTAPGCRIYPLSHSIMKSFDLSEQLELIYERQPSVNIVSIFEEDQISDEQEDRLFSSIEWYNRSCGTNTTIDLSLVCLAVAFETLLGTRREENFDKGPITSKIYTSISLLVGNTPRLDSWFEQFYNARSRILHEGEWSQLRYSINQENAKSEAENNEYGYLTHYGWLIFRICVNTILSGQIRASAIDLKSKFFHQQERLERMLANLVNTNDPYNAVIAILEDVRTLYHHPFENSKDIKIELVWSVGRKLAERLIELEVEVTTDQKAILQQISTDLLTSQFPQSEEIIKYVLHVLQGTDELPDKKVKESAIQDLSVYPPPSILKIKKEIEVILGDSRNKDISKELRQKLQNIVALIEHSYYRSKLSLIAGLATNWAGDFITRRRLFSLMDGYARFVKAVIKDSEMNTEFYLAISQLNSKTDPAESSSGISGDS
jgi:hypothetical protein